MSRKNTGSKTAKRFTAAAPAKKAAAKPFTRTIGTRQVKAAAAAVDVTVEVTAPAEVPAPSATVAREVIAAPIADLASAEPAIQAPAAVENAPAVAETASEASATTEVVEATSLIGQLRDGNADVARDAAASLAFQADSAAVTSLIEVLANVDGYYHTIVRVAAAASLGRVGQSQAFEALVTATVDPIVEVSIAAINALGALGDVRATDPLLSIIRNESGYFLPDARRAAILAVNRLNSAVGADSQPQTSALAA